VVSASGLAWRLTDVLGSGSEGVVYAVADSPGLVAKVVPGHPDPDTYRTRIARLVRQGREPRTVRLLDGGPPRLAWPLETLTVVGNGTPGYLMPDMSLAYRPFQELLSPAARREHLPTATWATALRAAANLARLVADLHTEGYVVGDLKPDNLWVDAEGRTAMADVDSLHFTDGPRRFTSPMRTSGYTAPECVDGDRLPDRRSDDFVLAVLVHQALMDGLHPFHGSPADGSPYLSWDDNMLHGRCRLTDRAALILPSAVPPADLLPRALTGLFRRCFGAEGRNKPGTRPGADRWAAALRAEAAPERLRVCGRDPGHVHSVERPWCPWCDREARMRRR
jgi:DNA-binding helix-hairpin-helix protein with protein kinase domain